MHDNKASPINYGGPSACPVKVIPIELSPRPINSSGAKMGEAMKVPVEIFVKSPLFPSSARRGLRAPFGTVLRQNCVFAGC